MAIERFIREYTSAYVSDRNTSEIEKYADEIMKTGIKEKDAYHVACAIIA